MKLTVTNTLTTIDEVTNGESKVLERIVKKLSCEAPGAKFTWRYKNTDWDGRVNFIDAADGSSFGTGYLPGFLELLDAQSVTYSLEDNRSNVLPDLQSTNVPLRRYQWEAAVQFFENKLYDRWWPRGILRMATGAGKTETAVAMVEMAKVPTTILVHRKDLMYQFKDRLEKYGIKSVGLIGDGTFQPSPNGVTVAMVQSLASRLGGARGKDKLDAPAHQAINLLGLLATTEFLIVDEAHSIAADLDKGNQFQTVLNSFKKAYMRLGLTATPFMRDNYSNFLLEGAVGKVIAEVSARELIEEGYLQDAKVKMFKIPALPPEMTKVPFGSKQSRYQHQYEWGIQYHAVRNTIICEQMVQLTGPTLVLCKTVAHGKAIQNLAESLGMVVPFISGQHSADTRKAAVDKLRKESGVLICTTIFDEGIDIPELQSLILAAGGRSRGRSLQRIGRGLRKATDKTDLIVVDFYDETSILKTHSEERRRLWKDQGYEVEIIEGEHHE